MVTEADFYILLQSGVHSFDALWKTAVEIALYGSGFTHVSEDIIISALPVVHLRKIITEDRDTSQETFASLETAVQELDALHLTPKILGKLEL